MFCKNCGKRIDTQSKFCGSCGQGLATQLHADRSIHVDPSPTPQLGSPVANEPLESLSAPRSSITHSIRKPLGALFAGVVILSAASLFFLLNPNLIFGAKKNLAKASSPTKAASNFSNLKSAPSTTHITSAATSNVKNTAGTLNNLLSQSGSGRSTLISTVKGIDSCSIPLSTATQSLQSVISNRQNLINQLGSSQLSALPSSSQLRSSLNSSWVYSLKADQYFLQWGQQVANSNCQGQAKTTSAYVNAVNESQLATTSKQNFLAMWNPIASQQSLPLLSPSQI